MTQTVTHTSKPRPVANGHGGGRIAFVQAGWHAEIVDQARQGFIDELKKLDIAPSLVDCFRTSGAFEIPLQAQRLAKTGRYDAIVAAALVVDGGIYRHEFVAETVVGALMRVQLETETPIFSVVLTPHHFHGHGAHESFFKAHFLTKGAEAAHACVETLENLRGLGAPGHATGPELTGVG